MKQVKKLRRLKDQLRKILALSINQYVQVVKLYRIIESIRAIFKDDKLSKEEAIKRYGKIKANLKQQLDNKLFSDEYREGYENLLNTMDSWEYKLFTYKSVPLLPKTNNGMELLFNKKKKWLRRVNGLKKVNKTFKLFGHYLIFIEESLSFEDIKEILNQINYVECIKKVKLENKKAKERFANIRKLRYWDLEFEKFAKEITNMSDLVR